MQLAENGMSEEGKPGDVIPMRYPCEVCGGDGNLGEGECPACNGSGYITLSAYWASRNGGSHPEPARFKVNRRRVKRRKTGAKPWSTLVGKFFHTFRTDVPRKGRGEVQSQGVVLSDLGGGYFVVQLFDFVMGDPSDRHVVHIERMVANGWVFYETDAEMRERWEHYYARDFLREASAAKQD